MAFTSFRYDPDAIPGLKEISNQGRTSLDDLKRLIKTVKDSWLPEDSSRPMLIIPFEGFLLTFTVSEESPSTLVLADVRAQPPS